MKSKVDATVKSDAVKITIVLSLISLILRTSSITASDRIDALE